MPQPLKTVYDEAYSPRQNDALQHGNAKQTPGLWDARAGDHRPRKEEHPDRDGQGADAECLARKPISSMSSRSTKQIVVRFGIRWVRSSFDEQVVLAACDEAADEGAGEENGEAHSENAADSSETRVAPSLEELLQAGVTGEGLAGFLFGCGGFAAR
jgi:WD40 repeat protein